jgi:hypothetical protein
MKDPQSGYVCDAASLRHTDVNLLTSEFGSIAVSFLPPL